MGSRGCSIRNLREICTGDHHCSSHPGDLGGQPRAGQLAWLGPPGRQASARRRSSTSRRYSTSAVKPMKPRVSPSKASRPALPRTLSTSPTAAASERRSQQIRTRTTQPALLAREALDHAYKTDFPAVHATAHEALAHVLTAAGRLSEARAELERALQLWQRYGSGSVMAIAPEPSRPAPGSPLDNPGWATNSQMPVKWERLAGSAGLATTPQGTHLPSRARQGETVGAREEAGGQLGDRPYATADSTWRNRLWRAGSPRVRPSKISRARPAGSFLPLQL